MSWVRRVRSVSRRRWNTGSTGGPVSGLRASARAQAAQGDQYQDWEPLLEHKQTPRPPHPPVPPMQSRHHKHCSVSNRTKTSTQQPNVSFSPQQTWLNQPKPTQSATFQTPKLELAHVGRRSSSWAHMPRQCPHNTWSVMTPITCPA